MKLGTFVTLKAAAYATGQSQQKFREKVRRGLYPERTPKGYDLVEVCRARVEELQSRQEVRPETLDLTAERARKERAQAEKTEFDLAIRRQHYVHVEVFEELLSRFASQAAARFDAICSRLKVKYPDLKATHIEGIGKEIAEARNAVAALEPPFASRELRSKEAE